MKVNSMLYIQHIKCLFQFSSFNSIRLHSDTTTVATVTATHKISFSVTEYNSHRKRMRERKKKAGDNGQTYETTFGKISNLFRRGLCMFYVLCTSCISHIHVYPSTEYAFYICTKSKPNFVCYILFTSLLKLP